MDRTSSAILRQLKALGPASTLFDVAGLWSDEKIKTRQWDRETVLRSVAALRAWNTQGAAIYVRPALPLGVVLLDDVTPRHCRGDDGSGISSVLHRRNVTAQFPGLGETHRKPGTDTA